ncbi:MAG TPA: hypothetical protein VM841_07285 [Actinomycetota bacterium]|nr:hypothetical protein [Actinomycetota bacterium]
MKIRTLLMAAAAGAAVAYFMDSERGAQRRAVAKQRAEQFKAQALPKIQELRRYTAADMPGDEEASYASNGSSTSALPS